MDIDSSNLDSSPLVNKSKSTSPRTEPEEGMIDDTSVNSVAHKKELNAEPNDSIESQQPKDTKDATRAKQADYHVAKLLYTLQVASISENKRVNVFKRLSELLLSQCNMQAYLYGSVALKTYLPDGDIDMCIIVSDDLPSANLSPAAAAVNAANPWHQRVRKILRSERNLGSVTDIAFIDAEVKLIKCYIDGIPIDMSANQVGGLATLCFLEEVDSRLGKDHLFKRSIILTKTWCYYESRLLGSHHGLISTYALTTLILFIFNMFYSELHTPLQVLLKFLDYYSSFDWDNCCVSIVGPVKISSLPQLEVIPLDRPLYLSPDFIASCKAEFGVAFPPSTTATTDKPFITRFLNIVDPLRDFNNLGRSVSRNSYLRIRRALAKGARELREILADHNNPSRILSEFFKNAWMRNKKYDYPTHTIPPHVKSVLSEQQLQLLQNVMGSLKQKTNGKIEARNTASDSSTTPESEPSKEIVALKDFFTEQQKSLYSALPEFDSAASHTHMMSIESQLLHMFLVEQLNVNLPRFRKNYSMAREVVAPLAANPHSNNTSRDGPHTVIPANSAPPPNVAMQMYRGAAPFHYPHAAPPPPSGAFGPHYWGQYYHPSHMYPQPSYGPMHTYYGSAGNSSSSSSGAVNEGGDANIDADGGKLPVRPYRPPDENDVVDPAAMAPGAGYEAGEQGFSKPQQSFGSNRYIRGRRRSRGPPMEMPYAGQEFGPPEAEIMPNEHLPPFEHHSLPQHQKGRHSYQQHVNFQPQIPSGAYLSHWTPPAQHQAGAHTAKREQVPHHDRDHQRTTDAEDGYHTAKGQRKDVDNADDDALREDNSDDDAYYSASEDLQRSREQSRCNSSDELQSSSSGNTSDQEEQIKLQKQQQQQQQQKQQQQQQQRQRPIANQARGAAPYVAPKQQRAGRPTKHEEPASTETTATTGTDQTASAPKSERRRTGMGGLFRSAISAAAASTTSATAHQQQQRDRLAPSQVDNRAVSQSAQPAKKEDEAASPTARSITTAARGAGRNTAAAEQRATGKQGSTSKQDKEKPRDDTRETVQSRSSGGMRADKERESSVAIDPNANASNVRAKDRERRTADVNPARGQRIEREVRPRVTASEPSSPATPIVPRTIPQSGYIVRSFADAMASTRNSAPSNNTEAVPERQIAAVGTTASQPVASDGRSSPSVARQQAPSPAHMDAERPQAAMDTVSSTTQPSVRKGRERLDEENQSESTFRAQPLAREIFRESEREQGRSSRDYGRASDRDRARDREAIERERAQDRERRNKERNRERTERFSQDQTQGVGRLAPLPNTISVTGERDSSRGRDPDNRRAGDRASRDRDSDKATQEPTRFRNTRDKDGEQQQQRNERFHPSSRSSSCSSTGSADSNRHALSTVHVAEAPRDASTTDVSPSRQRSSSNTSSASNTSTTSASSSAQFHDDRTASIRSGSYQSPAASPQSSHLRSAMSSPNSPGTRIFAAALNEAMRPSPKGTRASSTAETLSPASAAGSQLQQQTHSLGTASPTKLSGRR